MEQVINLFTVLFFLLSQSHLFVWSGSFISLSQLKGLKQRSNPHEQTHLFHLQEANPLQLRLIHLGSINRQIRSRCMSEEETMKLKCETYWDYSDNEIDFKKENIISTETGRNDGEWITIWYLEEV